MSFMDRKKSKSESLEEHVENGYFASYISEPPTLQHIAAVSTAIRLWSEPDIKEDIRQYSENKGFDSRTEAAEKIYKEYEKKVSTKLDEIILPDKLKYKISKNFLPIGLQLFNGFAKEVEEYYFYDRTVQNEDKGYCRFYDIFKMGGSVYWTMEGVIDNVTSLKELINNEDQVKYVYGLYELVCKYCFEECIPYIWGKLPLQEKSELDYIYENYDYHIVAYWTASIEDKLQDAFEKLKKSDVYDIYDNDLSIEQNMISVSIFVKNPYSLKYFWNKLKEYERSVHLEKWLSIAIIKYACSELREYQGYNDKTTSLCFLLSQFNDKHQQNEIFRAHSDVILKSLFYDWPWQRFFSPTFLIMMDYVSEETFVEMMSLISDEVREGNELFREIWSKSPLKLKKHMIQTLKYSSEMIYNFIGIDDVETIFEILKYATDAERKQILFNMIESYQLFDTLRENKLNLIDILISKYLSKSKDIDRFKCTVMSECGDNLCEAWIVEKDFQAIETLFAWSFKSRKEAQKYKKNTLDKNKIFCSLVCLGDYESVDRFMNWYFESTDDIDTFKKAFIHEVDEDNSSVCSDLLWKLSTCNQGWECFEKFVDYIFSSPEEVTEFKSMYLKSAAYFLEDYSFGFAHKFLMYCLGSIDEVNRFKKSFVTSEKGMNLVVRVVSNSYPSFYHQNELIKWFSISKESVAELKCKLDDIKLFSDHGSQTVADCKRFALLYMLDKHAGVDYIEYKKNDSDNIDRDINITKEIMEAYKNRQ